MLAKPDRLRQSKEIEEVFRRGQGRRSQFFYLKFLIPKPNTRVNVIVSAKVSKKSVIRHQLKRQAMPIIKLFLPKLLRGHYSLVIQPEAVKQTAAALKKDLESLFIAVIRLEKHVN